MRNSLIPIDESLLDNISDNHDLIFDLIKSNLDFFKEYNLKFNMYHLSLCPNLIKHYIELIKSNPNSNQSYINLLNDCISISQLYPNLLQSIDKAILVSKTLNLYNYTKMTKLNIDWIFNRYHLFAKYKWIETRLEYYSKYKPICLICEKENKDLKDLEIHHIYNNVFKDKKVFFNESMNELACLCKSCHTYIHDNENSQQNTIEYFSNKKENLAKLYSDINFTTNDYKFKFYILIDELCYGNQNIIAYAFKAEYNDEEFYDTDFIKFEKFDKSKKLDFLHEKINFAINKFSIDIIDLDRILVYSPYNFKYYNHTNYSYINEFNINNLNKSIFIDLLPRCDEGTTLLYLLKILFHVHDYNIYDDNKSSRNDDDKRNKQYYILCNKS